MILNLREFETFPAQKRLEGDSDSVALSYEGAHGVGALTVDLAIRQSGEEYYCQGNVDAKVELECARCLERFERQLSGPLDFVACSRTAHEENTDRAIDDEDYAFFDGSDLCVDISEVVRQAIVLAISMMPLCSDDCRGLCAQCGTNLNHETCDCRQETGDGRWEGLEKLSRQTKGTNQKE